MRNFAIMLKDLTEGQIRTLEEGHSIGLSSDEDLVGIFEGKDFDYWWSVGSRNVWEYVTYEELVEELNTGDI
jgi:hypothetical protein